LQFLNLPPLPTLGFDLADIDKKTSRRTEEEFIFSIFDTQRSSGSDDGGCRAVLKIFWEPRQQNSPEGI
jgi:hypothetical protein